MAVAGAIVVVALLVGGMLAYDSGRQDTIAKGISVGGIDVGGLGRAAAEDKLRTDLAGPLKQPIVANWKDRRFTLAPDRSQVAVNVEESVDAALERSREGGAIKRTLRSLTGGSIDADVDVDISYDRAAVSALVRRVRERLDKPARDADVDISAAGIERVRPQRGLEVDTRALSRSVRRKLVSATAAREFAVRAERFEPEVTTKDLAKKYPAVIVVDRSSFQLRLYEKLKPTKTYTVAIGAVGYDTPAGLYEIQNKEVNPVWNVPNSDWAGSLAGTTVPPGPDNPLKSRWLGIYNGAGIHGTDAVSSLGTAASRGCLRMAIPDVEELYERVDVGTPIYIA